MGDDWQWTSSGGWKEERWRECTVQKWKISKSFKKIWQGSFYCFFFHYLNFMWLFLDELAIVDNLTFSRLQHMLVKMDAMKMTMKSLSNLWECRVGWIMQLVAFEWTISRKLSRCALRYIWCVCVPLGIAFVEPINWTSINLHRTWIIRAVIVKISTSIVYGGLSIINLFVDWEKLN